LLGDGSAMSEGAAYGTDQSGSLYSPYSVYPDAGSNSLYKEKGPEYVARKKAVLAETKKRLQRVPTYIEKKKWFEIKNELARYMYETRGAALYLAATPEQKKTASKFFQAMEATNLAATQKNGSAASAANKDAISLLDAFTSSL
jgi:photosystem II oxygen-evolving enhancer protein 3